MVEKLKPTESKNVELVKKAKELSGKIQDYFNGHYRLDQPDIVDIKQVLDSIV
jgi:hypothetical protein